MSELTDLEICQKIAEINNDDVTLILKSDVEYEAGLYFKESGGEYDPLTDDALCFKLMIKHQIDFYHAVYADETIRRYEAVNAITGKGFGFSSSANKVICLAIIELHK